MTGATPYFAAAFVGGLFIVVGMVSTIFMLRHIKSTGVTVWKAFANGRLQRPQYNTRIVFFFAANKNLDSTKVAFISLPVAEPVSLSKNASENLTEFRG